MIIKVSKFATKSELDSQICYHSKHLKQLERFQYMPPLTKEQKAQQFCDMTTSTRRIGISEFARSKTWRDVLDESGCIEVTDRAESIGFLMTPDYAEELSMYIAELESELEQAYIRTLFELRSDYSEPLEGSALAAAALTEFNIREDKIREFLDGSK